MAAGLFLKFSSVFFRGIQFLASIAVLGIFAWFIWFENDRNVEIGNYVRAVTGLAGVSALYTLIAFFLVCCLGGKMFFAFLGIGFDIAFIAVWIAIAVLNRNGATSNCEAERRIADARPDVNTNFGNTNDFNRVDLVSNGDEAYLNCALQKGAFGIAIVAIFLFIITAILQLFLGRHHQKEKRNTNTPVVASTRRRFPWQKKEPYFDPEAARPSHDTAMTGATATDGHYANTAYGTAPKFGQSTNY